MPIVSVEKYLTFPKEQLKEYLELDEPVTAEYYQLHIEKIDFTLKTFDVIEVLPSQFDPHQVKRFTLTFTELVDNFLINLDPNIKVTEIKTIGQNGASSSIVVGY